MGSPKRRGEYHRVLVDMNTQCDYLLAGGSLPVVNRSSILTNIRDLMSWAREQRVPVISSLDAHRSGEPIGGLPPHCVDDTQGQRKVPFTLLPRRIMLQADNTFDVPLDPFRRHRQVILTKRSRDFLANPKADRLIHDLTVHHMIVFGVVTEHCIKTAALGLIARRRRVCVVTDACGHWSPQEAELSLRQMEAKGALLLTTQELISGLAEERIAAMAAPTIVVDETDAVAESAGPMFDRPLGHTPALTEGHCLRTESDAPDAKSRTRRNGNGNGNGHARPDAKPARPIPSRSWNSPGLA